MGNELRIVGAAKINERRPFAGQMSETVRNACQGIACLLKKRRGQGRSKILTVLKVKEANLN